MVSGLGELNITVNSRFFVSASPSVTDTSFIDNVGVSSLVIVPEP